MKIPTNKLKIFENLPDEVLKIFAIFGENIRLVGGSVRDLILEKNVNDYDFACKFLPKKIEEILQENNIKSIPTGLKYGTITAVLNHKNFQITTLRKDENQKGRDCDVNFVEDFYEDAKRRDFTINALYLDFLGEIHDYFNGIDDLKNRKVRFILDPKTRIQEDYLRILRFLRFSCDYAEELDKEGLEACLQFKNSLEKLSKERVREEFLKIISSKNSTQIINILNLFKAQKIDEILWNLNIDNEGFNKFLTLEKYITKKDLKLIKIAIIFLNLNLDLKNFNKNFCLTKNEKIFLQNCLNLLKKYNLKNIDEVDINEILVEYSKNFVLNFYIILYCKNFTKISQNHLENIIKYITNLEVPNFLFKISDLEKFDCPQHKFNSTLKALKIKWAQSNFKLSHDQFLIEVKNLLK
jgi:poly(A) polymerase